MRKHVKIYLNHFGYDASDFVPCELCNARACDIHHIEARGMGGSKEADHISNLQALCRKCHIEYGDKKQYKSRLQARHNELLSKQNKAT